MKPYLIRICLLAAAGGFLFGFDTSVISGVIEYIAASQVYNLTEISKGGTVSCIIIGCMIGCVLAGPLSTRGGRKGALIFTAFVFFASSLGCAFAGEYGMFIGSRIVAGIAVGAAFMLAPIYIAEISPANHRGKLVSLNLFAIFPEQSTVFIPIISFVTSAATTTGVGWSVSWPTRLSCFGAQTLSFRFRSLICWRI